MTSSYLRNPALLGILVAGGLAFGSSAMAAPEGLYSADELLDADVYTQADPDDEIGEVEDILLDNDMQVRAIVIDTGNLLDMGERQYVLEAGQFTVETQNGNDIENIEYRVMVDMSEEELTQQPEYTNDWWQNARQGAQEAWEQTKQGAASAWETTQEGASQALDRIGQALENVGERTQDAASE
ncbi:PRC-barrel domain-containing protein [Halomonas korlensis]|uniref:PRC-barrel domain-containing protein n=1 Tax=Halomonas korlensis TaxID=463301 RepID=A0A1I7HYL1_9GAMM|nr:PRC-barrel domain-containing protein [Halomonas korlensis]SFU65822.1 PRC-barrel domain-containing protein [Halomonas korlensis]